MKCCSSVIVFALGKENRMNRFCGFAALIKDRRRTTRRSHYSIDRYIDKEDNRIMKTEAIALKKTNGERTNDGQVYRWMSSSSRYSSSSMKASTCNWKFLHPFCQSIRSERILVFIVHKTTRETEADAQIK